MKLFIWKDPHKIDYGGTCLYVMANDLQEARNLALAAQDASYGEAWNKEPVRVDVQNVEPDRVIEGPYAELYQWSE